MPIRFDLITIDVVEPRLTAAAVMAEHPEMRIELDEDDGRWLVLASTIDARRFGLQRSDAREIEVRSGSIDDVLDGCMTLPVPDAALVGAFFDAATELVFHESQLESNGVPVLTLRVSPLERSNLHLDLACDPAEFDMELERLLDSGATRIGPRQSAHWGESQIFASPGGNLFCLNAYVE